MSSRLSDHTYHRSRVDIQIQGAVLVTLIVLIVSLLLGDRFKPLSVETKLMESTVLVFDCSNDAWVPIRTFWFTQSGRLKLDEYIVQQGKPSARRDSVWDPPPDPVTSRSSDPEAVGPSWHVRQTCSARLPVLVTRVLYPNVYAWLMVIVVVMVSYFLYVCARRQTYLMNHVYSPEDEERGYDRPWGEIRVTFWALYVVQGAALLLLLI